MFLFSVASSEPSTLQPQPLVSRCTQTSAAATDSYCSNTNTVRSRTQPSKNIHPSTTQYPFSSERKYIWLSTKWTASNQQNLQNSFYFIFMHCFSNCLWGNVAVLRTAALSNLPEQIVSALLLSVFLCLYRRAAAWCACTSVWDGRWTWQQRSSSSSLSSVFVISARATWR